MPKHKKLRNIRSDISNISNLNVKNIDCCIHLASIANDPMAELDKSLSWETSALNTYNLMEFLKKIKAKRLIYASSGSVYGISEKNRVSESTILKPISLYNKVKMVTERVILSYSKSIENFIIRPATVCGYSPRMRLDVAVNALTFSALLNKKIKVFGGKQVRPNIHIDDMCDIYRFFLKKNKKYTGIYNAGFENISILDLGKKIKKQIDCEIKIIESNDPRSYRQCSDKLIKTGYQQKFFIDDAISQISHAFHNNNLTDDDSCYTVKWMKDRVLNV